MSESSDPGFVDPSTVEPQVADDPAERERESERMNETRYERELEADAEARRAAAERLKADDLPEPATEE